MRDKCCLVTVGTTSFDSLTDLLLSEAYLNIFEKLNFSKIIFQIGNTNKVYKIPDYNLNIEIEIIIFSSDFEAIFNKSDLIITHCGAGTILNCLKSKKKFIVVPNNTLQGNHQTELAEVITKYCIVYDNIPTITTTKLLNDVEKLFNNKFEIYNKEYKDIITELVN